MTIFSRGNKGFFAMRCGPFRRAMTVFSHGLSVFFAGKCRFRGCGLSFFSASKVMGVSGRRKFLCRFFQNFLDNLLCFPSPRQAPRHGTDGLCRARVRRSVA